ncbi:MAG: hypothetical protein ACAH80_08590 [Alphaproteobacteria bacterium]
MSKIVQLAIGVPVFVVASLFGAGLYLGGLNYSGVCLANMSKLSEADMINIAVTSINSHDTLNIQTPDGVYRVFKQINYTNTEEFLRDNPNCCSVTIGVRKGDDVAAPGIMTRLLGFYRGDVNMNYTAKYLDDSGTPRTTAIASRVTMTNCGVIP